MLHLCFGTNDKLYSRLIRWATGAHLTHAWVEYKSAVWGGWWVAHSTDRGVIKEVAEGVDARYPTHRKYECRADLSAGLQAVRSYVGTADYDWAVIWNALLLVLYRATNWEWLYRIVARNGAKMVCAELVGIILKESGLAGTENFDPELMTTGMLDEFCASSEDCWVI
jgi:hypothetical protein